MVLAHAQQATSYPAAPVFLSESAWSRISLQKHVEIPVFQLNAQRPTVAPKNGQKSTVSLREHPELRSLLNDERFRRELQAEPVAVLARFGVHLQARDVPPSIELPAPTKATPIVWTGLF